MAFVFHTRGSCFCGQNLARLYLCANDLLDIVENVHVFVAYAIRLHLLNANSMVLLESCGVTLVGVGLQYRV